METFRRKTAPLFGIQRPDGSPTSEAGKAFMREVAELLAEDRAVITIVPGTNYMYLVALRDQDRFYPLANIQPGDWVLKWNGEIIVWSNDEVLDELEVIEG